MVVHGQPGLDEISPLGPTRVVEIRNGLSSEWVINPEDYDLATGDASQLAGGGPEDNARIITETLGGGGTDAGRAAVVLNAAAAIYLSGRAATFKDGVEAARKALSARAGIGALEKLRAAYST